MIRTLPNPRLCSATNAHTFSLVGLCPISKNPQPGSTITIRYRPLALVLEVYSMTAYLHRYIGGYRDAHGLIVIRDMEQTIQQIANDCAKALDVRVRLSADLLLDVHRLAMTTYAYPLEHDYDF